MFSHQLRDPKQSHLRTFHILLPALIINFVEHMVTAKEIMSKTKGAAKANTAPAAFTDDGFAMGKTSEIDKK